MIAPAKSQHYDAIVIGSGMGGLTTASILAQVGKKRVLVLERHFKLGGFTHCFRRKDYEWDVGVHYVGDMQPGSMTRSMMDLVTRRGVEWTKMGSPFETFIFPEGSFDVPSEPREFLAALIERFPAEAQAIRRYFRDVRRAQHWLQRWVFAKQYPQWVQAAFTWYGSSLAAMRTSDYLAKFQDPLLRAILAAQWPDYGTPPKESAFGIHGTVTGDFMHGGFYPLGGSKEIAAHAVAAIEDAGGECLASRRVEEILVRDGVAYGVRISHKGQSEEFYAPAIVSNAGACTTFRRLVPPGCCERERAQANRVKPGPSALILFLGLNDDPRKHGFDDRNYWVFPHLQHEPGNFEPGSVDRIEGGLVAFGSLRNPHQTRHVAQIVTLDDRAHWARFDGSEWLKRGEEYEEAKNAISQRLIEFAEQRMPGLRGLIDYHELSTPLTVESLTSHPHGMIYGQACDANRLFGDKWSVATSLKNLYLTGSDVGAPGVNGALFGGVMTAAKLLGPLGIARIMMHRVEGAER